MGTVMRGLVVALMGAVALGCGGRSAIWAPPGANGGSSGNGGDTAGTGSAGNDAGDGGDDGSPYGQAPVPTCTGELSMCEMDSAGDWNGAAVVKCDPVYFVGPWTLLLQRSVGNQFQTVLTKVVEEPGFGAELDDASGPPVELTYRVCVLDDMGQRCGQPFQTSGPPDCKCIPTTCALIQTCNTLAEDGCGGQIFCKECTNGAACNPHNFTCCPDGQEPDGTGGCQCAPPFPGCHGGLYWDPSECTCELAN
jgi:hypothetical protein